MTDHSSHPVIARFDRVLEEAVGRIEDSPFVKDLAAGKRVLPLYEAYLREAYHFVRLTSSFTPLAARRMDPELLGLRQWILHHSAHEMGHELMALQDLEILGQSRESVKASQPRPGTWQWVHFFYYQVVERPPFAAMGVLYFLEGMAAKLAPIVVQQVLPSLEGEKKRATLFVREHGELDLEHTDEQKDVLVKYCTNPFDQDVVCETILQASYAKRAMIDHIAETVGNRAP